MFIEILFKMLLFKGDVIYAEHCISFTFSVVSQWDKYEIVTEMWPFKTT